MSTALVTGASGFIGSHLVRGLVREGLAVHALCRAGSDLSRLRDVMPRLRIHEADVLDFEGLVAAIRSARPDYVFHLGGASVIAGAAPVAKDLVEVNLLGTVNLLDACESVDYRCLVQTGDAFEYGLQTGPLQESDVCRPDTLHGITRLGATLYAQARARNLGRPIVTLRLFSVYGPCDHPRRLVPRVIAGALAGTPIALSRPEIARDWVYVEDIVELYMEASRMPARLAGGVFNAGSGRASCIADVVETVLRLTGSRAEARWGAFPVAAHDAGCWVADMRQTFDTFAWRPRISLEQGLEKTIAAVRHE